LLWSARARHPRVVCCFLCFFFFFFFFVPFFCFLILSLSTCVEVPLSEIRLHPVIDKRPPFLLNTGDLVPALLLSTEPASRSSLRLIRISLLLRFFIPVPTVCKHPCKLGPPPGPQQCPWPPSCRGLHKFPFFPLTPADIPLAVCNVVPRVSFPTRPSVLLGKDRALFFSPAACRDTVGRWHLFICPFCSKPCVCVWSKAVFRSALWSGSHQGTPSPQYFFHRAD